MRKLLYNACIVCASCLLLFPCRVSANESTAIFEEVTDGTSNLDLELSSQTLTDTSSSNEVTVEGNLPEGAKVSVTELNTEDYLSVLAEYYNTSVENVFCVSALDITIETEDGEEFQPKEYNETVTVTIQDVETTENDKEVIHIEETSLSSVSTMLADNTYTEFETDSFSVYLIGGVSYDTSDAEFLDNDYASAYLFSDGRLLVTAFKKNGAKSLYPWDDRKVDVKTVSFADNVTFIGDSAFYEYPNLTGDLVIPNSVTNIGNYAFAYCSGLTGTLTIPDSVTSIGDYAFQECSGFTGNLTIPDSVTTIGQTAFFNCEGFTGDLIIPNSVTSIGEYAFYGCSGFTGNLVIPNSVTTIGDSAFEYCSGFTGDLVIPDSITTIGAYAFYECSGFTGNLTIPNSVTTIGNYAFAYCDGLTGDLVIPDSVTSIDAHAFIACSGFGKELVIPNSVTTIGAQAFDRCSGIIDITIGTGITEIGAKAFYVMYPTVTKLNTENEVALAYNWSGSDRIVGKYKLNTDNTLFGGFDESNDFYVLGSGTTLDIPLVDVLGSETSKIKGIYFNSNSVEFICDNWCNNSGNSFSELSFLSIPASVKYIGSYAFYNCTGIGKTSCNNVVSIGDYAFYNCKNLYVTKPSVSSPIKDLSFSSSVRYIGKYAFANCIGFNRLTLPSNLETISEGAFANCTGITRYIGIPDSIVTIDKKAFYNCSNFGTILRIPSSVTKIGDEAFYNCAHISTIEINSELLELGKNVFYVSDKVDTTLNTQNAVALAYDWVGDNRFTGIFALNTEKTLFGTLNEETGVLVITGTGTNLDIALETVLGEDTSLLKELDFQTSTIESICNGWCNNSSSSFPNLTGTLTLPGSVKQIGDNSFKDCDRFIGTLIIPDSVETIGDYAFKGCLGFSSALVIPDNVIIIGAEAFSGCSGITDITIGPNVTSIGNNAFYVPTETATTLNTSNAVALNYDWSGDNRVVSSGYILNVGKTLFGNLDSDTGVLSITGTGKALDIRLSTALGEDASLLKGIEFQTSTIETICNNWCDNYKGSESKQVVKYFDNLSGTLVLPNNLKTIGSEAFRECTGLTGDLVIPDSVTSIGESAFYKCSGFTGDLVIPNSVTSIEHDTFYKCSGFNGNLTIPNSVTTIGYNAFEGCSGLTGDLVIPNSVTSIGSWAFENCSSLTGDLVIPDSVTTIGLQAFKGCSGFTGNLVIPNSVTSIKQGTFWGCSGLTGDLVIPNSVTTIEASAFSGCSGFTGDLIIPDSVTTIGNHAFFRCSGFTGNLTIPNSVTTISNSAFYGCSGFGKELVIPDSVTSIGDATFYDCPGITDITIGTGVSEIGDKAFYVSNKTMTKLDTENEVALNYDWAGSNRIVGAYVLSTDGSLLGTLNESTGVLTVSGTGTALDIKLKEAMGDDTPLVKGLYFESTSIETICYKWCDNITGAFPNLAGTLDLPDSLTTIDVCAFDGCSGFTGDLTIPNSVTTIGARAFSGCYRFTGDLTIPDSVTTIGARAFQSCFGFTGTLTLPDNITSIAEETFCGCPGFTEPLYIPDSVTTIGDRAFCDCDGIKEITVGTYSKGFLGIGAKNNSKLTSIGNNAFYVDRKQITTLNAKKQNTALNYDWAGDNRILSGTASCTFYMNTEETLIGTLNLSTGELVITGEGKDLDLTLDETVGDLPLKSLNFQTQTIESICTGWASDYKSPEDISGALNLPNSLKYIGESAFEGCSGLTGDLTIPSSVTTIENAAFYECSGFTGDLIIPDSVTDIGIGAFAFCEGLTGDLTIPETVDKISWSAFGFCPNLGPTLTIPESVTSIEDMAFAGCNKITSVKIADSNIPITIGENVFACGDLNEVGDLVPVATPIKTKLYTTNESVLAYDWAGDMRDIELGLKKYTLNTESTLFGYLDTDTGELTVKGSGTTLDVMLVTAMGDDASLVKNIVFATDNLEVIGEGWCDNYSGVLPNLQGTLTFPSTLKTIEAYAFRECTGITGGLIIPSGVIAIGNEAFYDCVGLTGYLSLPDSLNSIGSHAFFKCSGLTGKLNLPSNISSIGSYAFYNCSGFTGNLTIPESITVLNAGVFMGCSGLTGDLTIPDSVTSIASFAFENCSGFNGNLTIPSGVTTIGSEAFYNCSGLKGTLTIPDSVESIGQYAFFKCSGFTGDLALPDSVTALGEYAFYNCSGLDGNLKLPASITCISEGAFLGCASLSGALVIPESVTVIESHAFQNCSGFTGNLEIPSGVTTIGDEAFYNCTGLNDKLVIPNTVTSMGNASFAHCTGLTKFYIGNGVTTVGTKCFYVPNLTDTKLFTKSTVVKEHTWSTDNRNVSAMNSFVVGLPQNISLSPTYLNSEDDPVYYASFNMEVSGQFESGSCGKFTGVPSFTISSDSGDTRTVTTNITDTTLDSSGTIVVPVVLEAPNPDLSQEFTGTLNIATTLVEDVPESLAD